MTCVWHSRLVALTCWLFVVGSVAFADAPKLNSLFPAGGRRGTDVDVKCHGTFDWPPQVYAPGVDVQVGKDKGELKISIPDDLASDRVWVRLFNSDGISSPVPFLVGGVMELLESEPNNRVEEANSINLPTIVNGVLSKRGEVDAFAVELDAGDTLVSSLDANTRLGSPMDAMLQIVSPEGTVVAENHDVVGLDPRIVFTAPTKGIHVVRVFSFSSTPNTTIAYQGGKNYIYRLLLTRGPFVTHASPLSIGDENFQSVIAHGWNVPADLSLPVHPLGQERLRREYETFDKRIVGQSRVGFAYSNEFAGFARIRIHPMTLPTVHEANGTAGYRSPFSIVDRIRQRKQSNTHKLVMTKGETYVIAIESVSLHSSLVPLVRLLDPNGKVVAEVLERGPAKDAVVSHQAALDGEYEMTVRDRFRGGGDRFFYRLSSIVQATDFDLAVDSDQVVATSAKPAEVTVKVSRRSGKEGQVGPIKIRAMGLPDGVSSEEVVSETTGDSASKVVLKIANSGAAWSGPIQILGVAESPREIRRYAMTPAHFGAHFDFIWLSAAGPKK